MTEQILMYGSVLSPLVGICIGVRSMDLISKALRLILILMIFSVISDITMLIMAKAGFKNLPVAHAYGLIESLLLLRFFSIQMPNRLFIRILAVIFICFYLIDSIFITHLFEFNAHSRSLEAALMILLSVSFFFHIYKHETNIFIDKNPEFLIVVGIMVYFSGAFFSFLLATDILSNSSERFYGSWILHNFSNIFKNVIFTVGLWRALI